MSRADGVIRRLDAALNKVAPPTRTVYKRTVTRTGGDALIGRPGAVAYTDVELKPQPFYARLGRQIVGSQVPAELIINSAGTNDFVADEWIIIFSPTSISLAELSNPDLVLAFKDTAGNTEVFRITDTEPLGFSNQAVMYVSYIRSTERPASL